MIDKLPETNPIELHQEDIHLEDQIHYISEFLSNEKSKISFSYLFQNIHTKLHIIVTFLALLEMLRLKSIFLEQKGPFDDILIGAQS